MKKRLAFLLVLALNACTTLGITARTSDAVIAQEMQDQGRFVAAIAAYRRHLAYRESKPLEGTNPYFYALLIGDCYLELGKIEDARSSYALAQQNGVAASLVGERYRRIAEWYAMKGDLETAIAELSRYRELDPLLFDLEIDRFHKEFVAREIADEKKDRESDTIGDEPETQAQ